MTQEEKREAAWHLDKKVPIALIIAIGAQTFAVVWGGATLFAQVQGHERAITTLTTADALQTSETRRISETLARLDERIGAQTELLRRLETAIVRYPVRPER